MKNSQLNQIGIRPRSHAELRSAVVRFELKWLQKASR